jgi:hypothetical protein
MKGPHNFDLFTLCLLQKPTGIFQRRASSIDENSSRSIHCPLYHMAPLNKESTPSE